VQQTQNTPSYREGWHWCPLAATERQHLNNITVTFSTKVEDTAAYTAPSSVSRLVEMQHRAVLADKTPTIPDFLDNARDVSSIIWSYCMHRTDAAYCYRRVTSSVVLLCVCVCVRERLVLGRLHWWALQNQWIDRDAVWRADLCGPKQLYIRWGYTLAPRGEYHWTTRARRQCYRTSNYVDHLLL